MPRGKNVFPWTLHYFEGLIFTYENGDCMETDIELSPNAQVFYYLIEKVEDIYFDILLMI